eukprot:4030517-Pyramimonas_sp.AAC.3
MDAAEPASCVDCRLVSVSSVHLPIWQQELSPSRYIAHLLTVSLPEFDSYKHPLKGSTPIKEILELQKVAEGLTAPYMDNKG